MEMTKTLDPARWFINCCFTNKSDSSFLPIMYRRTFRKKKKSEILKFDSDISDFGIDLINFSEWTLGTVLDQIRWSNQIFHSNDIAPFSFYMGGRSP